MIIKTSTNNNTAQVKATPLPRDVSQLLLVQCWHCERQPEDHANGACLFGSTQYRPYGEELLARIQEMIARESGYKE